jgi:hypothetical protein
MLLYIDVVVVYDVDVIVYGVVVIVIVGRSKLPVSNSFLRHHVTNHIC